MNFLTSGALRLVVSSLNLLKKDGLSVRNIRKIQVAFSLCCFVIYVYISVKWSWILEALRETGSVLRRIALWDFFRTSAVASFISLCEV